MPNDPALQFVVLCDCVPRFSRITGNDDRAVGRRRSAIFSTSRANSRAQIGSSTKVPPANASC